jgi:predicted nucleic acid-binding protein
MAAMKAVIDSDVLIDFLHGIAAARDELERYRQPHYSIITWMELHCGARDERERAAVQQLLATMTRVELSTTVAQRAVELRQQLRLKLPDAIVLASAETEGCILVSRNTKDFPHHDPRVRFPYTI